MRIEYKAEINEKNISSISNFKVKKILKNESLDDREGFILYLISKWVINQEVRDADFIKNLKRMFRKFKIKLTDTDMFELTLLEERSFSEYRHIKVLNVATELLPKENVGVKYTKAQLYSKTKRLDFVLEGDLLVSNKRIIFENNGNLQNEFYWDSVESYSYQNYGFEFTTKNKESFVIRIHDQETLNNTMTNIISKKIKNIITKEV